MTHLGLKLQCMAVNPILNNDSTVLYESHVQKSLASTLAQGVLPFDFLESWVREGAGDASDVQAPCTPPRASGEHKLLQELFSITITITLLLLLL